MASTVRRAAPALLAALLVLGCSDSKAPGRTAEAAGTTRSPAPPPAAPAELLANMQQDGPRASDGVRYGKRERFRGTLLLAREQSDFVAEDGPGRGRPVSLDAADPATDDCLGRIGAGRPGVRRLRASFLGRRSVEDDGAFGHFGTRSGQVRLERFLSGDPCR
ncbi:MAG: hypothetical protein QOH04_3145 [Sphingomonadales bacterium]|jgi:hypothetical protein|nr:hypothetical protein [Sphingomonadales bacterium]